MRGSLLYIRPIALNRKSHRRLRSWRRRSGAEDTQKLLHRSQPRLFSPGPWGPLAYALLLLCTTCSPESAATAVVVGDVLKQLETSVNNALLRGRNEGDAVLTNAASLGSIAAANAAVTLRDQLTFTVKELRPALQEYVGSVQRLAEAIESAKGGLLAVERAATVDVLLVLSRIGGEKFFVDRVTGVTQLKGQRYRIRLSGIGMGAPSEDRRAVNTLALNGTAADIQVSQPNAREAVFDIPAAVLDPHFDRTELHQVKVDVTTELSHRSGWLFKTWRTERFTTPFYVALLPEHAGTLQLSGQRPDWQWRKIGEKDNHRATGDHHCQATWFNRCNADSHMYEAEILIKAEEEPGIKQRLTNPKLICYAGPCAWSNTHKVAIDSNGFRAHAVWDVNSHPTQWKLIADLEEYRAAQMLPLGEQELSVEWHGVYDLHFPADAKLITLAGKLLDQTLVVSLDAPGIDDRIKILSDFRVGNERVVQIQVSPPRGMISTD